eukprot:GHVP01036907.1.p1 GENE.GHVP01036907.1~~GHVP01036907.1.p1  ORF type:complete len:627 (-),score=118.09 GHVP01036907.1:172-2052(-)
MATKIIIPTKDAPIRRVVLYADGAEVTRRMHITPESTGFHDIKIEGVTTSAQKESIRVRGTGNCVINEVSTNDVIKKFKDEKSESEAQRIAAEIDANLWKIRELRDSIGSNKSAMTYNENYYKTLLSSPAQLGNVGPTVNGLSKITTNTKLVGPAVLVGNPEILEGDLKPVHNLLEEFRKSLLDLTEKNDAINEEIEAIEMQNEILTDKLKSLVGKKAPPNVQNITNRDEIRLFTDAFKNPNHKSLLDVVVNVEIISTEFPLDFELTYLVRPATWTPAYDLRLDIGVNDDESSETNSLKSSSDSLKSPFEKIPLELSYFANIDQNTGEDWVNVELTLSTAPSNVSGAPPPLVAKSFGWKTTSPTSQPQKNSKIGTSMDNLALTGAETDETDSTAVTANFDLPPTTVIKSGKVLIAKINLEADALHYIVPAKEARAYQIAKCKNTSEYSFLKSSNVSIFIDNSFVARSSISAVSPNEQFAVFLGVDPAVRVNTKKPKTLNTEKGLTSKQQIATTEYSCHVSNTHPKKFGPRTVACCFPLPRSSDQKIQVKVLQPTEEPQEVSRVKDVEAALEFLDRPSKTGFLNKITNHVLLFKTLEAGETKEFNYKYEIKSPVGQEIYFYAPTPAK